MPFGGLQEARTLEITLPLPEKSVFFEVPFGSVARDEARPDSDVDLLVEFDRPVGLFTFVRLKRYLEEILGSPVDLGTPDSLKPYLKEAIIQEVIRAF